MPTCRARRLIITIASARPRIGMTATCVGPIPIAERGRTISWLAGRHISATVEAFVTPLPNKTAAQGRCDCPRLVVGTRCSGGGKPRG